MNEGQPLWSRTDFILADLVDAANAMTWVTANRELARHERQPYPEPYPRPGLKPKKTITAADLVAFRERTKRG